MTLFFWFVFLLAIVSLVAIPFQKKGERVGWSVVLAVILFIINLFTATYVFGYGKVTFRVEEFSERLTDSIAYELVSSDRDGSDYVLLLKKFGSSNYKVIRTNTIPPKIFTLVNGKPVAIQPK